MKMKEFDFSGYATKNGLKCSDGRTIMKDAFKHNDGQQVPLVWQHLHNEPNNVLGHAILENRDDGMYCYGKFNDTEAGKNAKELVKHGDINALSIYANDLKEQGKSVFHGAIREVSLVLSGANPGALIDNLSFAHADNSTVVDDTEAIIYTGLLFNEDGELIEHAESEEDNRTIAEIFDKFTDEQKDVVYILLAHAVGATEDEDIEHSSEEPEDILEDEADETEEPEEKELKHEEKGDTVMKKNVFDKENKEDMVGKTLSHSQIQTIVADAQKLGSLKESFLQHAVEYGIENIDFLFPDAQTITNSPDFVKRRTEWVNSVLSTAKHTPFSRIKSLSADLTYEDARAKGYVKGALKKEEFFALAKRVTTPTTIYKKQKLDRDDIIDITTLDVVAWLKAEMRVMLDEELGRAALIGDGRDPGDDDKINETNIRPISKDDDFYAHKVQVPANTAGATLVEEILRARTNYKGSGTPTFYTTEGILTDLLLVKDKIGRRLYTTESELAAALRVAAVVPVEVMEGTEDDTYGHLVGILVNMKDYVFGADKGGQVSMFDDFDIDYNQYKYLIETRCSGALTKPKSALVFWRLDGTLATPTAPTFVSATNTLTIPTVTGVVYSIDGEAQDAGAIVIEEDTVVSAAPADTYYFNTNVTRDWTFIFNEDA